MSQTMQKILDIDPNHELRFVGPFSRAVVTMMRLKNNLDQVVIFKIKTTAPKRYCVRPNIGKIMPYKTATVEISLQPFAYDRDEKYKHKFMVQSVIAPENADLSDLNALWKDLESEHIIDAKLRCIFEEPLNTVKSPSSANSSSKVEDVIEEVVATTDIKANSSLLADERSVVDNSIITQKLDDVRHENSELIKENTNLKEQIVRLRCLTPKPAKNEPYAPNMDFNQIPVFYLALAIFSIIMGVLMGKYVL